VAGDVVLDKGVHEWEWELKGGPGCYGMIGIVPSTYSNWTAGSHIGDSNFNGHGLFLYSSWSAYRNNVARAISPAQSGQGPMVIGVRLDMDKRVCEFWRGGLKGGVPLGEVFTGIVGPVRPAVTLYNGSISILK